MSLIAQSAASTPGVPVLILFLMMIKKATANTNTFFFSARHLQIIQ
jgi:hypothetical protein